MNMNDNDNNDENPPPPVETITTTPPSESALLEYVAQVDHGYEHEITMFIDIHANFLGAIEAMFSEPFEVPGAMIGAMTTEVFEALVAMCTEAFAMIHEVGRRRHARSLKHRSMLYVCCQIIMLNVLLRAFMSSDPTVCGSRCCCFCRSPNVLMPSF